MGPLAGLPVGEKHPARPVPTGRLRRRRRVRSGLSDQPGGIPRAVPFVARGPVRRRRRAGQHRAGPRYGWVA